MKNANMGRLGHLLRDWNNRFFTLSSPRNCWRGAFGDLSLYLLSFRGPHTGGNPESRNKTKSFSNKQTGSQVHAWDDNDNGNDRFPTTTLGNDIVMKKGGHPKRAARRVSESTARVVSSGFTLIELLVVVLIIGILASVAVPQYTKAVWKARFSEALVTVNAMEKALQLYVLQNGYTQEDKEISPDEVDIDVFKGLNKNGDYYCSKYVCYRLERYYRGQGFSNVAWRLWMYRDVSRTDPIVEAGGLLPETTDSYMKAGEWYRFCYYEDDPLGQSLCAQTEHLGWQDIAEGF